MLSVTCGAILIKIIRAHDYWNHGFLEPIGCLQDVSPNGKNC